MDPEDLKRIANAPFVELVCGRFRRVTQRPQRDIVDIPETVAERPGGPKSGVRRHSFRKQRDGTFACISHD